jgi:hypothetical protein
MTLAILGIALLFGLMVWTNERSADIKRWLRMPPDE